MTHSTLSKDTWFPLFANLVGKNVLVVGADEVAERKLQRLLTTGANITVISEQASTKIQQWHAEQRLQWLSKPLTEDDIQQQLFVLVAAADAGLRQAAQTWANKHNILVNVVDQQHASTAIVPAVVDRSPLVVAIGSGGNAPELARMVRSKIEHLLPQHLGELASLVGNIKLRLRRRFPEFAQRRHFLQWVLNKEPANLVANGNHQQAHDLVLNALKTTANSHGHVSLVGAGPGDPELVTLKALQRIENADSIVFDGLVDERILDYARRDATFIDVSKRPGQVRVSQEGIHTILSERAALGEQVVRLKGGDPMIFGRGGEEIAWLRSQGISHDVVPGITAASACASYAGFPLTQRGFAQSVRFVTAHCERSIDRLDWQALAQEHQTLAFYMSVGQLQRLQNKLLQHGRGGETPVALVENGSRPEQRVVVGTLETLYDVAQYHQVQAPAILYVGEVAELAQEGSWFHSKVLSLPALPRENELVS